MSLFIMLLRPPSPTLFPYTTLFRSLAWDGDNMLASGAILDYGSIRQFAAKHDKYRFKDVDRFSASLAEQDRKSTRLNSSHTVISYAVFCLKNKNNNGWMSTQWSLPK